MDQNVINIIKDYLKPFPFKKEIELLHSEARTKARTKYFVFVEHPESRWRNSLFFYTKKGEMITFTESIFQSTRRNISYYSPPVTQYEYCEDCLLWHHWDIKGCPVV